MYKSVKNNFPHINILNIKNIINKIDYLEIIHTLKNKIKETDDLIEVKK